MFVQLLNNAMKVERVKGFADIVIAKNVTEGLIHAYVLVLDFTLIFHSLLVILFNIIIYDQRNDVCDFAEFRRPEWGGCVITLSWFAGHQNVICTTHSSTRHSVVRIFLSILFCLN